jgi:hypothetical protein
VRSYRPLSRVNVTRKLAREYFTLIGILSQSAHGLAYFDRVNLYENLYSLHKDARYVTARHVTPRHATPRHATPLPLQPPARPPTLMLCAMCVVHGTARHGTAAIT